MEVNLPATTAEDVGATGKASGPRTQHTIILDSRHDTLSATHVGRLLGVRVECGLVITEEMVSSQSGWRSM